MCQHFWFKYSCIRFYCFVCRKSSARDTESCILWILVVKLNEELLLALIFLSLVRKQEKELQFSRKLKLWDTFSLPIPKHSGQKKTPTQTCLDGCDSLSLSQNYNPHAKWARSMDFPTQRKSIFWYNTFSHSSLLGVSVKLLNKVPNSNLSPGRKDE